MHHPITRLRAWVERRGGRRDGTGVKRSRAAVQIRPGGGLDQVELISPGAMMITAPAVGADQGPEFVFDLMGQLDEPTLRHLGFDGDFGQMRSTMSTLRELKGLSRDERRRRFGADGSRRLRRTIDEMVGSFLQGAQGFQATAATLWKQSGTPDLPVAANAGLFTFSTDALSWASSGVAP